MDFSTYFPAFLLLALAAAAPTDPSSPLPTASPSAANPPRLPIAAAAVILTLSGLIILSAIGAWIWWFLRRPTMASGEKEEFAGDKPLVERPESEKKRVHVYPTLGKLADGGGWVSENAKEDIQIPMLNMVEGMMLSMDGGIRRMLFRRW
jgi:hypothetical protein